MRILVTAAHSRLGAQLAATLARTNDVRTLAWGIGVGSGSATVVGDPRDREVAARATVGCDAIVHIGPALNPTGSALEALDQATRGTNNLITTATKASRFVLLSSLRFFERYPESYRVDEQWAPRPTAAARDLVPYLAEATVRETSRVLPLMGITLRLGTVVDGEAALHRPADPRWLHVDDLVLAVERALQFQPDLTGPRHGWWVYHIPAAGESRFPIGLAGQEPFGYRPTHSFGGPPSPPVVEAAGPPRQLADKPGGMARKVVIFGAGGPLAAAATTTLERDHVLRLTDARAIADIAADNRPQSPGAPLPRVLAPPHELRVVDVTDMDQVAGAVEGMDAIINCTVVRPHPVEAFRVNTLGAHNVMRAAIGPESDA